MKPSKMTNPRPPLPPPVRFQNPAQPSPEELKELAQLRDALDLVGRNEFGMATQQYHEHLRQLKQQMDERILDLQICMKEVDPRLITFTLVKFSMYGSIKGRALFTFPGEVGATVFNINDGIVDNFCTFIDPKEIPRELGKLCRDTAEQQELPYPTPFDDRCQQYKVIAEKLEAFFFRNMYPQRKANVLYCCSRYDIPEVVHAFKWLYEQFGGTCPFEFWDFTEAMQVFTAGVMENQALKEGITTKDLTTLLIKKRTIIDASIRSGASAGGGSASGGSLKSACDTTKSQKSNKGGSTTSLVASFASKSISGKGQVLGRGMGHGQSYEPSQDDNPILARLQPPLKARGIPISSTMERPLPLKGAVVGGPAVKYEESFPTIHPYSASLAICYDGTELSLIDGMDNWAQYRGGLYIHPRQVEIYLDFLHKKSCEKELACLYHMELKYGPSVCSLSHCNRYAYNMLDALTFICNIEPQLTKHVPGIKQDSRVELRARRRMLQQWNVIVMSSADFELTIPPPPPPDEYGW